MDDYWQRIDSFRTQASGLKGRFEACFTRPCPAPFGGTIHFGSSPARLLERVLGRDNVDGEPRLFVHLASSRMEADGFDIGVFM